HGLEDAPERVPKNNGIRFVNDSKATNVVSARRAIESFDGRIVAIMGGRFKGGNLGELRESVASRVDAIVAIGEATPLIHTALSDVVAIHDAASMPDAVRTAFGLARAGGVVLLAPPCASFDMFHDYAERGRVFKDEVKKLEKAKRT